MRLWGLGGIKKETPCIYSFCTAVGIGKNTTFNVVACCKQQRLLCNALAFVFNSTDLFAAG